ncbi:MAG: hypothetical protein VW397_03350 [Candidatus Margulisiibacteriota bacterium]
MSKRKKITTKPTQLANDFSADVAPNYVDQEKRDFKRQGRISFLDEFYTLYRKWVKNE